MGVEFTDKNIQNNLYNLNFGPQHPARHGVLRLVLTLLGERISSVEPHIGLLHRGTEKLLEYKTIWQSVPYFDRLDYVSIINNEHGFSLRVEKLLNYPVPYQIQVQRVLMLELTRIINHLIAITTHRIDVGRLTPFLWGFEEREKLIEIYENRSGARMHANWIRPGGIGCNLTFLTLQKIERFLSQFGSRVDEIEELLTQNRIWVRRTKNIGILGLKERKSLRCSGIILRSSGEKWDLRKCIPYEIYTEINFNIPIGINGDCYDRYILRVYEIRESIKIRWFCINKLLYNNKRVSFENRNNFKKLDIEDLIQHFKYTVNGLYLPYGEVYIGVEAPKGEFGVYLIGGNSFQRYRVSIKVPGLLHLFRSNNLIVNHLLSDLVTIIGTQDLVFGEVDR